MNEQLSGLQQENAELSSKASRYENELNRLENSRRDLEAKLKGTGATVRIKNGAVSVLLPGAVLFDPGKRHCVLNPRRHSRRSLVYLRPLHLVK